MGLITSFAAWCKWLTDVYRAAIIYNRVGDLLRWIDGWLCLGCLIGSPFIADVSLLAHFVCDYYKLIN